MCMDDSILLDIGQPSLPCGLHKPLATEDHTLPKNNFVHDMIDSFSDAFGGADWNISGAKRARDETHSTLSGSHKRCKLVAKRVQFAKESKMKMVPNRSDLEEMEAKVAVSDAASDAAAAAADETGSAQSEHEVVEILAQGGPPELTDPCAEEAVVTGSLSDEILVKTKEDDGPSTENVATQALVVGLIERTLSGAASVVDHLRSTIRKNERTLVEQMDTDVLGNELCTALQDNSVPSPPDSPPPVLQAVKEVSEAEMFDLVVSRMQLLIDRIESRGRATLLPSTAQIGPPFVPALKFLQRAIRCAPRDSAPPSRAIVTATA
mmetsp:Transcript_12123/g.24152  ORF Transcript_12123/g.24152 Transcript_12123/m.24152 type:complete len:322 (+) Transcript_12123:265-1230(+)|eukprot:CAMPEP_0181323000 /NCGR_PEP_ID=MMETSP1101-20121128/19538_1 /TAXON_ID=46948 /ORGANISM="Rhodomonas abbreviata, Strain Caron Lab Isolate" /LENGTH=321 /DNA_ID=CAMNT_0023430971 /DNA_START=261 /DNA_END=1226 /DNA_ORIENTATION=+